MLTAPLWWFSSQHTGVDALHTLPLAHLQVREDTK